MTIDKPKDSSDLLSFEQLNWYWQSHETNVYAQPSNAMTIDQVNEKLTSIVQNPKRSAQSSAKIKLALQQHEKMLAILAKQRRYAMQLVNVRQSNEFLALADCHDPQTDKLLTILQNK